MLVTANARQGERFSLKSSLCFKKQDENLGRIFSGMTLDLNVRGACVFSPTLLEENDAIRLWLLNPNASELACVAARVVWTAIDDTYGDGPYWLKAGLVFFNVAQDQYDQLTRLLPAPAAVSIRTKKSRKHLLAVLP